MSARRGRSKPKLEDSHPDERWLVSYSDMVTVLMCLFIVLFAMSTVDVKKYDELKNSLATGFGQVDQGKIDNAIGMPPKPDQKPEKTDTPTDLQTAEKEVDKLTALKEQMNSNLNAQGLGGTVAFVIDQRGLTVKLVGSQSYFMPDSPVLAPIPEEISVEGHCANLITGYASTWELSSARATAVLRNLVEVGGVAGKRIGAVGFGSARQVNNDQTEAEHEENRRVDVVVLSDQQDKIRALIPQVLKARGL